MPREPFACGARSNGQTATASSRVTDWEADLEIGVASLVDVATTRDSARGAIREEIGGHKTGGKTNAPGQMEHSTTGRDEGRKQMGGQQTRPGTETWNDQEETKEKEAIDKGERKLSKTELDTITQLLGLIGRTPGLEGIAQALQITEDTLTLAETRETKENPLRSAKPQKLLKAAVWEKKAAEDVINVKGMAINLEE